MKKAIRKVLGIPARILRIPGRIARDILRLAGAPFRWWHDLEAPERVLYRAVACLGVGFGLAWLPLAFIVPGVLFALVFFGFSLRRAA